MKDQLVLDLDYSTVHTNNLTSSVTTIANDMNLSYNFGAYTNTSSPYTISTGSITGGSYVGAPTNSSTITIGSQTITEDKLKVLDDVVVGMQDWQEEVNKKLAILQPNPKLENQWSELKELREQYVNLERELQEKSLMWDILKD